MHSYVLGVGCHSWVSRYRYFFLSGGDFWWERRAVSWRSPLDAGVRTRARLGGRRERASRAARINVFVFVGLGCLARRVLEKKQPAARAGVGSSMDGCCDTKAVTADSLSFLDR